MDFLVKLDEEYQEYNQKDAKEDTAIVELKLAEPYELPLIHSDTKDRLQHLEAQLRIVNIDAERKTLNTYKNLLKVKWIGTNDDRFIESIIFNEKTPYLNLVKLETADPCRTDKLWHEMSKASSNLYQ